MLYREPRPYCGTICVSIVGCQTICLHEEEQYANQVGVIGILREVRIIHIYSWVDVSVSRVSNEHHLEKLCNLFIRPMQWLCICEHVILIVKDAYV